MKNKTIIKSLMMLSILFSSFTFAISLDEAKQKGLVGEKDNGYLGVVTAPLNGQKNTPQGTQNLVKDINAKRKEVYIKLAAKNGITVQQVEKLAADKAYNKTSSGHYLWKNGKWAKK